MTEGNCSTCRFRAPDPRPEHSDAGHCRRFPPKIVVIDMGERYEPNRHSMEQHFPWMAADEWCGEYQVDHRPVHHPTPPGHEDCEDFNCKLGKPDECPLVPF